MATEDYIDNETLGEHVSPLEMLVATCSKIGDAKSALRSDGVAAAARTSRGDGVEGLLNLSVLQQLLPASQPMQVDGAEALFVPAAASSPEALYRLIVDKFLVEHPTTAEPRLQLCASPPPPPPARHLPAARQFADDVKDQPMTVIPVYIVQNPTQAESTPGMIPVMLNAPGQASPPTVYIQPGEAPVSGVMGGGRLKMDPGAASAAAPAGLGYRKILPRSAPGLHLDAKPPAREHAPLPVLRAAPPAAPAPQPTFTLAGLKKRRFRENCECLNCVNGVKGEHVCSFPGCGKLYLKTSHLRAHIRNHFGQRPFACDWRDCNRKFTRSDELIRHKRTHTGERRFDCTLCDKRFQRSDHLNKHMRIHQADSVAPGDASTLADAAFFDTRSPTCPAPPSSAPPSPALIALAATAPTNPLVDSNQFCKVESQS